MTEAPAEERVAAPLAHSASTYALIILGVGVVYFAAAKLGLALASIHPSASPIWPPTGIALAALLLLGYRAAPAILAGAFAANVTTAGTVETATAIACGNTLEAMVGTWLINHWSGGRDTFDTPTGVAKFGLLVLPAAAVSATIGVGSLAYAGFADPAKFAEIWLTWWLGDVAGALVITPVLVLWFIMRPTGERREVIELAALLLTAVAVGLFAFSPLLDPNPDRSPLGFLAIVPLLWAALRRNQRDTATVALLLSCLAIWGTLMGSGPFARATLNESFLMLVMFTISISVPSLALSADVRVRKRTEETLRTAHNDLDHRVRQRTAALAAANRALETEIEQKKRAESELEQQRVHLLEAQRLANLGSWVWDIPTNRVSWSEQLYAIYGVAPGEFKGTYEDFLGRIHPEDRAHIEQEIARSFRMGQGFRIDERILRPNGEVRYLQSCGEMIKDERGNPVRMLGICQDVTERKQAEAALRESEQQYRQIVDSVRDYAIIMLDREGRVVSWNPGAARIKQYSAGEIIGRHFGQFYTEEDLAGGEAARALEVAAREGKYESEGWRVRRDGTHFYASMAIHAIREENGNLIGFAKVTRDITERREAQLALEHAREQLAQIQKMEALGQLTGGIAHDFNNLLMIVSGHAQMLRRRLSDPKDLQALDAIRTAVGRGESLTRQLLAFARRQPLSRVAVDLRERIEAVREMLGSSLRANIRLEYDIPDDVWPVELDLGEFELALVNVVVNARDAMPEGGGIVLSASNVTLDGSSAIDDLTGEFVALAIADSGTGIPRDVLPKVFEPFFTTKAVGKGTGLGLSQVYGFARRSGGTVTIRSDLGKGTVVTLYLPRTHRPVAKLAEGPDAKGVEPAHGTILLVEDNSEVAHVTSALLQQLGYQVARSESADEALTRLENGERFDLVFSDIVMPGEINGLMLAREIGRRYPDLPVLLTSGYSDMVHAAEMEPVMILRKPFDDAALGKAVRDALRAKQKAA